jgi:uncharacterized protein YcbX
MVMNDLGTLAKVLRYPVKSMLGESLEASELDVDGIPGDRAWGVRDEQRGDFFVGKRCAALMSCSARYAAGDDFLRVPEIRLPDGEMFSADADGAGEQLTRAIGRDVSLWPVVPEARRAEPKEEVDPLAEMQAMMAREAGEPEPDFSNPQPELLEVYAREGPFFDAFPLMLMTKRSLASISAAAPESQVDVRRFRPNLLVETDELAAFPEQNWIGQRVSIGQVVLKIQSTCVRCVMTTHGFADVSADPRVMRALVREAGGNLGVYATVEEPGRIARGDSLVRLG